MKVIDKIEKLGYKLGRQKHLLSLKNGITLAMPLILIGSLTIILTDLPVNGWDKVMEATGLGVWAGKIISGSFGILGLVSTFGIAKSLAEKDDLDGISAGILALSSYIILVLNVVNSEKVSGIPYNLLGSRGLFVGILVGLITAEIFKFFVKRNIVIKMPKSVPPEVSRAFSAIIPGAFILFFWGTISHVTSMTKYESLFGIIIKFVSKPLTLAGTGLIVTLIAVLLNSLFWTIGIHGGQIISSIMGPIWLTTADENRLAYEAGKALPHIITQTFLDSIVYMGGGGVTIGLAILLFFYSKSKQNKVLGKLALSPGLFNINEPLMFGLPIVMNLKMWIPFILAPLVTTIVSYFAMYSGLVARTTGIIVPWATPPIISGYLATGHISGAILQVVTIILSIIIYYPFFKSVDREYEKLEKEEK